MVHAGLDRVEELLRAGPLGPWRTPGAVGSANSMWVGLLCTMDDMRLYGYLTNTGIKFLALVEDGWVQRVTARHFWRAGVRVENSRYVTVRDSRALAPHSVVDGGRRYNFMVEKSQLVLFQGNVASHGRHAYVGNGETLDSGIVFLDNVSEDAFTSSEAHRQWSMGFLYDHHTEVGSVGRETHDRRIHLGNRGDYGTQHGWACANCVVWNAQMNGALVIVEKPPTAQNYAIGVQGAVSSRGPFLASTPYIEGTNRADLSPRSLYLRQLADRLRPVER